jgi:DNA polymerase-1
VSRPLLVIDAPYLLYRAFYGLPDKIKGADGRPANALLGSTNTILAVSEERNARAVVTCMGPDAAPYRVELYPGYHAHRPPMPRDLAHQWELAPKLWEALGWDTPLDPQLEADDLLGALASAETDAGGSSMLFTGDRDMFQCVSTSCAVLYPGAKGGPTLIDEAGVRERYGIAPNQVPDFIALRGDPSDGLPGAKGIGAKTAAELLRIHGDLETLIAAADSQRPAVARALRDQADELRAFKEIATLQPVAVELPADRSLDAAEASAAARKRGMNRLAERLEGIN